MMAELAERYEDAVEGILHLLGRNAEIIAERERARRTAVALEQALVEAEEDVKTRDQEIENWKRIYDASQSDNQEQRDRIAEYDDKLIAAELEADELRRALKQALSGEPVVEFAHELTADHIGALVRVEISDEVVIEDRVDRIEIFESLGSITVCIMFATIKKAFEVSGGAPTKVLEAATLYVEVPF